MLRLKTSIKLADFSDPNNDGNMHCEVVISNNQTFGSYIMLPLLTFFTLIVPGIIAFASMFFDGTYGRDRVKELPVL
jgi:hypothetical protein